MTSLAYCLISNALPFTSAGLNLTHQALEAVGVGLWVDFRTLETGVNWEAK